MLHRVLKKEPSNHYYFQRQTAISWPRFIHLLDEIEANKKITKTLSKLNRSNTDNTVYISFDDGYIDNTHALDEILRRNMVATLFPVKSFIQQGFSVIDDMAHHLILCNEVHPDQRRSLTSGKLKKILRRVTPRRYRQLRQACFKINRDAESPSLFMSEKKLKHYIAQGIEVGIHGVSHRIFTCLSNKSLRAELHESQQWLYSLGAHGVLPICFPHGAHDASTVTTCLQMGSPLLGVDSPPKHTSVWQRIWIKEKSY
ncbi:MAG: polysaccharide deacetylase family protein [Gammaproteobacteria bacterium]|nr:polysaccharide deacetylase family protein [Gammaproteobacteria bacterium]